MESRVKPMHSGLESRGPAKWKRRNTVEKKSLVWEAMMIPPMIRPIRGVYPHT